MNKKDLEQLTREYLSKMKSRVMMKASNEISDDLKREYSKILQEFTSIEPMILERYTDEFEFDPMKEEIESTTEDIVNNIARKIVMIKRGLENDEDIKKIEYSSKEEPKKESVFRMMTIQDKLIDAFRKVETKIRLQEIGVDFNYLRRYTNNIIDRYTTSIAQKVFENSEEAIVKQEVEGYIEEINLQISKEKNQETTVEWQEGKVCPVVKNTSDFTRVNKQIADNVQEEKKDSKKTLEKNNSLELPADIIE